MDDPARTLPKQERRRRIKTRLPVLPPLIAVVEMIVIFGVLLLVEWLYKGPELADIRPHPFWLPVLLLSLQYGTISGLVAASAAIMLRASAGFPEQTGSETYFNYLIKIWIEPILWLAAAVLLGQFRLRQIGQKQDLVFQVRELASQRAALADYSINLRQHCHALERQIAVRSAPDVLLALQAIEHAHARTTANGDDEISDILATVIGFILPGARASLYTADATGLRFVTSTDAADRRELARWIAPTEPLYRSIVGEGMGACVLAADGERRLGGTGVAAVPIFSDVRLPVGSGRRVVGMLKIEQMQPASLNETCLPALATVGRAFVPALEMRLDRTGQRPVETTALPPPQLSQPTSKIWRHFRWFGRDAGPTSVGNAPVALPRVVSKVTG